MIGVTIQSREHGTHCHQCGHFIEHFMDREFITLRHLALFGRQVERRLVHPGINVNGVRAGSRRRLKERRGMILEVVVPGAFEKQVLLARVNSTVWDVRIKEGIGYEAVRGIIDRLLLKTLIGRRLKVLKLLGLMKSL
ncbi:MAG: hypothetical protein IPL99_26250 [Candidatus Competibacteraceae bacterium]|nr:hypothetical protein [Candidatus Competibacteraceae bacterium]